MHACMLACLRQYYVDIQYEYGFIAQHFDLSIDHSAFVGCHWICSLVLIFPEDMALSTFACLCYVWLFLLERYPT